MDRGETERRGRSGRGLAERLFLAHLAVYVVIQLMLLLIDLADGGTWWFFYPLFGWGAGLAAHGILTFGWPGDGKPAPRTGGRSPAERPASRATTPPPGPVDVGDAKTLAEEGEARVARLWRTARRIESGPVREQAFRVCAAADRVAEALAAGAGDAATVRVFLDRYLGPAEGVLERYVRLAGRGVAAAEPALTRVETHDLPLLESKLGELYEHIHRGDVIELEVAREMLELDLDSAPPRPQRRPSPS